MYDLFLFKRLYDNIVARESSVAASGGFCGGQTGRQGRHFPMAVRRREQSQPSGPAVAARIFCARRDRGLLYKCTPSEKPSEQNGCSGGVSKLILKDLCKKWKSWVYEKLAIFLTGLKIPW